VIDEIVERIGAVCLALPEVREEDAWVGTRWRVRTKTFAHVLTVDAGWPPDRRRRRLGRDPRALTESYCVQAPAKPAAVVDRPLE